MSGTITEVGQRSRIVDAALSLMSQRGAAGTSMRQLATACGLNVATIYHYFPSKADLLRAVIEERRYGERIATEDPPIDSNLPPRQRLEALLIWVWDQTQTEHTVLRLVLGEGVRGDVTAQQSARDLIAALERGMVSWMERGFPELADRGVDPAGAGRLIRRHLLALEAEHLATGHADGASAATELAAILFD
ncbi:MAG TPA: TetR/AcrR family transcriptional regulator [Acidimicrobiales bacterium]